MSYLGYDGKGFSEPNFEEVRLRLRSEQRLLGAIVGVLLIAISMFLLVLFVIGPVFLNAIGMRIYEVSSVFAMAYLAYKFQRFIRDQLSKIHYLKNELLDQSK